MVAGQKILSVAKSTRDDVSKIQKVPANQQEAECNI